MTNSEINKAFLAGTDAGTRAEVLASIAKHYGITPAAAFEEVTDPAAEHLLDYMTGAARTAASVIMKRHALGSPAGEKVDPLIEAVLDTF